MRKRPVRSLLFGVTLFLMLDIGRYLVWPPVGWLETEQPRTTSFMEYRQEQWQNGPKAKDGKAMRIRQHCLTFLKACIGAGTQPDFFLYPGEPHNMRGHQSVHLHERITQYFEDYLK